MFGDSKRRFLCMIVRTYGDLEFRFLMRRDPFAPNDAARVKANADATEATNDSIFNGSLGGKFKFNPLTCWNALRKLGAAKLDEKRQLLQSKKSCACKDVRHYSRLIALIDNAYFGNGDERIATGTDVENYEDALSSALLAACGPIREAESAVREFEYKTYEIHFDFLNREVIIAKKLPRGLRGWILSRLDYGFGVDFWRKTIKVGEVML